MKKLLLLTLVFATLMGANPASADDGFYVVAIGGVGTKITSLPYTINSPGFYYLGGNFTLDSGNGITVNIDNVTIDLMGFCLSGNGKGYGIVIEDRKNVEIRNGTLCGWNMGINNFGSKSSGNRVINIRAQGNSTGIQLAGFGSLVKGCTAIDNQLDGITVLHVGTISNNVVNNCLSGIVCNGGSVIGNTVTCNNGQTGFLLTDDKSLMMDQNTVSGDGTHKSGGDGATYGTNAGF